MRGVGGKAGVPWLDYASFAAFAMCGPHMRPSTTDILYHRSHALKDLFQIVVFQGFRGPAQVLLHDFP